MPILAITICAGVAIAASAIVKLCLPDVWVLPDWVCQQCHFDLRGSGGDRCPECGNSDMKNHPVPEPPWPKMNMQ